MTTKRTPRTEATITFGNLQANGRDRVWVKRLVAVDPADQTGFAFHGDFIDLRRGGKVFVGDLIVVCSDSKWHVFCVEGDVLGLAYNTLGNDKWRTPNITPVVAPVEPRSTTATRTKADFFRDLLALEQVQNLNARYL